MLLLALHTIDSNSVIEIGKARSEVAEGDVNLLIFIYESCEGAEI